MKGADLAVWTDETGLSLRGSDPRPTGANGMVKSALAVLAVFICCGSPALATDVSVTVLAQGFESSAITVGPGCDINYRVLAELGDAENQGLASIAFDLEFSGGALTPGQAPTLPPMTAFAPPNGLSNPGGFGGTPEGGRLLQVGGAQNVVMHGQWRCETNDDCPGTSSCDAGVCTAISGLPLGNVASDVGYPGSAVAVVTGSLITPAAPGVYDLVVSSLGASVLELGSTGRQYWPSEAAQVGSLVRLSVTVEPGGGCSPGVGACCLPSGLCISVLPEDCINVLGGLTHGTGTLCEGDYDGDGADGMCGDLCPDDPFKLEPGLCGCGVEDDDTDTDGDTVPDCLDQCPGMDDLIDLNNNGIPDCLEQQQGIPTISNWGLVVFAGLLAGSAVLLLAWRRL